MIKIIKKIFCKRSYGSDLYEDAFLCCWQPYDFRNPIEYLKTKYSNKDDEEINKAYELAKKVFNQVNNIPFYNDKDSPSINKVVDFLKNKIPGLSNRAYRTAADKALYLWHK